jgi:oligosaccharide translocation protein RFT1
MGEGDVQQAAMSGAKWLIVSNIFQKLFTFGINQVIIRQSSPEIFGIAAVQLELLLSTLLFISRLVLDGEWYKIVYS